MEDGTSKVRSTLCVNRKAECGFDGEGAACESSRTHSVSHRCGASGTYGRPTLHCNQLILLPEDSTTDDTVHLCEHGFACLSFEQGLTFFSTRL